MIARLSQTFLFSKKKATINGEWLICSFVAFCLFCLYLINSLYIVEFALGIPSALVSTGLKIIIAFSFLLLLPEIIRRLNYKFFIFVAILALFFLLNYIGFPQQRPYVLDTSISFWTMCFVLTISVCSVSCYGLLIQKIESISKIISWLSLIFIIIRLSNYSNSFDFYSMGFGYSCLLPSIFLFRLMLNKPSILSVAQFTIVLIAIILVGSRGPLIGIVAYLFFHYYVLLVNHSMTKRQKVFAFLFASFIILSLLFYKQVLQFFIDLLSKRNISNRTLSLLLNDTWHDSGRQELQQMVANQIIQNPFEIRGINADYLLIGIYSHNLFLELIYSFGLLFGGVLVLFIVICIAKTLVKRHFDLYSQFCIILMCSCLITLMFSGSLWTSEVFWMWLCLIFFKRKNINSIV